MGDVAHVLRSDDKNQIQKISLVKSNLIPPPPMLASKRISHHLICLGPDKRHVSQLLFFVLKVGALEMVKRFSRSRAPFVWQAMQSLQFLVYPPFNWIQRWRPLKKLVEGIQVLSRPLLFLSVLTAFSDHFRNSKKISKVKDSSSRTTTLEASEKRIDGGDYQTDFDRLSAQLHKELQEDGIIFPDRMNKMEIQNFYIAASGDYSTFKQLFKRAVRWRASFRFLSSQELEKWNSLVFWHGRCVSLRPCLIIRLGLAFTSLSPHERPCFNQAVVSQLEHGVQHLVNDDDPQITALVDCHGLTQRKFPLQMMRICTTVLQDHYPNRLGAMLVTRLPSALAIAEEFIQNLKPITEKKVRIFREKDIQVLADFLQPIPSFLGGSCTCGKCHELAPKLQPLSEENSGSKLSRDNSDGQIYQSPHLSNSQFLGGCEHVVRKAVFGLLMLWVLLVFLVGMQDHSNFKIP